MRLGVDLGGTKIEIVALSENGDEQLRRRVPTPKGDYGATVMAIAALVRETEMALRARGTVGIGIPGTITADRGLVKNANSTWLIGKPLQRDLQALLKREVRIANDANCFALSEATDGAAANGRVVFGAILGTGVGGGIVVDGRVITGANGIAGEWGHNVMPGDEPNKPLCYCGRRGCVETFLSGPAMAADHVVATGRAMEPAEIATGALHDPHCRATLERWLARLAAALAQVMNVLDPDIIVLGGGLSNIAALYDELPRLWRAHVFSDAIVTRLVRNRHGDSSGVRGAARLWP